MSETTPILQFGTSRFLLAHADLFISEAMEKGEALGAVTIVQTTSNPQSAERIAALEAGMAYPVHIKGLADGQKIDIEKQGRAITRALFAGRDWARVRQAALAAKVILSNTGDKGFDLDPGDTRDSIADRTVAPRSFPAKIATLLLERFETAPASPISIFPCEMIQKNGDRLREIIRQLATEWQFPEQFFSFLDQQCHFANSLVDRIVSEPLHPVGAVAEPYALWAIERQNGLVLPCTHPSIVLTDDLVSFEHLKLHILNLGHTCLADIWLSEGREKNETVREIMGDANVRARLENVWKDEVLPVFSADGLGEAAARYVDQVRERFLNPYLDHRLADIAGNHAEKKKRRLLPIIERATALGLTIEQSALRAMLADEPAPPSFETM